MALKYLGIFFRYVLFLYRTNYKIINNLNQTNITIKLQKNISCYNKKDEYLVRKERKNFTIEPNLIYKLNAIFL